MGVGIAVSRILSEEAGEREQANERRKNERRTNERTNQRTDDGCSPLSEDMLESSPLGSFIKH
jgi:hypothetical protein